MKQTDRAAAKTILTALVIGCVTFFVMTWLLSPIFSGRFSLPQSVGLFGLKIQIYGIIIAFAALGGYWLAMKRMITFRIHSDHADKIILYVLIAGFVGARLYHVVSDYAYYFNNPAQIFMVWNGGLSIYGAGIGGALAIYLYARKSPEYSALQLLDWLTPSVVLGQIIGRFGNFVNYELYGTITNLPWKMFVPVQFRIPPFELNQFFHPLFLYEASGSLVILIILLRFKMRTGYLFLTWLLLYNVLRFSLEQIRLNSVIYNDIRVNAIVSFILILVAGYFWHRLRHNEKYAE